MDVLTLSQTNSRSLAALDEFVEGNIVKICKHVLQKLLTGSSTITLDEKCSSVIDAVATLLLDAARTQSSESALRGLLQEQGLRNEVVDLLCAFYNQQQDTLVNHLAKIGINFAQVVGIDWRLDYDIKSKDTGKDGLPVFYVTLHVVGGSSSVSSTTISNQVQAISFTASLEELQDLLAKVRDAVKEVDRVLLSNSTNSN